MNKPKSTHEVKGMPGVRRLHFQVNLLYYTFNEMQSPSFLQDHHKKYKKEKETDTSHDL